MRVVYVCFGGGFPERGEGHGLEVIVWIGVGFEDFGGRLVDGELV